MAITFTRKAIEFGGPSKTYTFINITMATTDTITISGLKQVWDVSLTNRPTTTFTYTSTGPSGTAVLTLVATASSTGPAIGTGAVNLLVRGTD